MHKYKNVKHIHIIIKMTYSIQKRESTDCNRSLKNKTLKSGSEKEINDLVIYKIMIFQIIMLFFPMRIIKIRVYHKYMFTYLYFRLLVNTHDVIGIV